MNIKKLFATLAGVSLFAQSVIVAPAAFAANYGEELEGAYKWAYENGITTMPTIDDANMLAPITRAEMAKMLANWAMNVKGKTPDTSRSCTFTDTASVKGDLAQAIIDACQLGLMGQGITAFRPYDTITRAEFGTALSRALWGTTYEGGNPYYANHLNALKAAGIMNQIANAESMKEVRGYVMLMLQRSEEGTAAKVDCDDAAIALACELDPDKCPAECKEGAKDEDKTDEKVRSGDLEVSASAGNTKILINGTSDLDTLTFKSSEEVEITKVILERYGYSTNDDVDQIWLENEEGTVISNVYEGLDSKGQAKLTIKKDYRKVDGTYNATIVLKAKGAAGKTLGFKVVDVDSTAKNLNVDNYKPYTYEMVDYKGAAVTLTARGTTKEYNWESGKLYEIAKFKVKAPSDSGILVKGFTLSLTGVAGSDNVDIKRYLDKAEATVDGKDVSISYEINKDDQLVVSFKKEVKLEAKDNVEFTVSASLSDDFNNYGNVIKLNIAESSDFNAIDSKTESRVTIETLPNAWPAYTFKWGKSKLTNTKLGNVDGAQASNDIVIAEGNLSITQDIKWTLQVKVSGNAVAWITTGSAYAIQAMRVSIAGDEYEGKLIGSGTNYDESIYEFANIEISDGGKVQFRVDIRDTDAYSGQKLTFGLVANNTFSDFKYVENKNKTVDLAGSISFSPLTIQAAKASLTNSITKDVEFKANEVTRKAVFDGTYSAKKGDLKLNEFAVSGPAVAANSGTVTFYLIVDGDEVADAKLDSTGKATSTFTNVEIDAEKSVKLVLEAEVDAKAWTGDLGKYELTLKGEDENGNVAGEAKKTTTKLKIVEVGAVNVSTATSKKDILRRASNVVVAEFTVKPANNASEVDLDNIQFTLVGTKDYDGSDFTADDITVTINGVTEDYVWAKTAFTYEPTTTVGTNGVTVKIELNEEAEGVVSITNLKVNKKLQSGKDFVKSFYPAVAKISKQEDLNGTTRYTISLDKDDDVDVKNFRVYNATGDDIWGYNGDFSDGDKFSIPGTKDVVTMIEMVTYEYSDGSATPTCSDPTYTNESDCENAVAETRVWKDATYALTTDVAIDPSKTYYTSWSTAWEEVETPDVVNIGTYYEIDTPAVCSVDSVDDDTVDETDCYDIYNTWDAGYDTAIILKDDLADYFKIGSNEEDLKVFKL